jgi:hypothetical protein
LTPAAYSRVVHLCFIRSSHLYSETFDPQKTLEKRKLSDLCDLRSIQSESTTATIVGRNPFNGAIYIADGQDIWVVKDRKARKLLSDIKDPAVSPLGDKIAFDRDLSAYVVDTASLKVVDLSDDGCEPCWSANEKMIACVPDSQTDPEQAAFAMDSKSGKIIYKSDRMVDLDNPYISPSGRYLAVICSMSRPVQGDSIWFHGKGNGGALVIDTKLFTPKQYWPGVIEDWSVDERWILWDWRTPDPNNDGSWLSEDIGLTSLDSTFSRKIDRGQDAHFSPDGNYIFYLKSQTLRKMARQPGPFRLIFSRRNSGAKNVLAKNVTSYLVY